MLWLLSVGEGNLSSMERFQSVLSQILKEFWLSVLAQMVTRGKNIWRLPREVITLRQRAGREKRAGWLRFQREWRHGITLPSPASVTEMGPAKNQSLSTCERPHMLRLAPGSGKAACEFWCRTNGPHLRPCQHPQTVGGDANHSCLTPLHPHSCHFGSFQVKKETFPSPSSVQLTWPLHLAHIFRCTEKYLLLLKNTESWN